MPPLPPNIGHNARSHSLDGLLDSSSTGKAQWTPPGANTAEGLNKKLNHNEERNKMNQSQEGSKDAVRNTTNRRSKSLDDLLDDDQLLIVEDERETQSMENILASNESITECCASPDPSEKMCENEVMTVDNSMMMTTHDDNDESQNDSGIQCDTPKLHSDASSFEDDTISNTISLSSSTASDKKTAGKTFLNKYVKKVKNLIKK